ncbi:hypothetical protein ABHF91_11635 [Pseudaeromonas sp. ZJS20]|uniref:hypothetical protein n=1 Tax=Pseudaeromonas aegiceratis TaxID=3153928 RepID=UPI00390CCF55
MQDVTLVGLGWLGLPLYHRLTALGLSVAGTVTQEAKCQQLRQAGVNAWPWQATGQAAPWPEELKAQTLILAIAPGRQDDYPVKIAALCQQAAAAGVQQLLYLSSTSVFAHQGEKDEQTVPDGHEPRALRMLAAEQVVACCDIPRKTVLRLGGLVGPGRYPGCFLAGKRMEHGQQGVNLLHQDDAIGIISAIVQQQAWEPIFHGVAPDHPSRQAFYTLACQLAGLPLPQCTLSERPDKRVLGQAVCARLGYRYQVQDWLAWLTHLPAAERRCANRR